MNRVHSQPFVVAGAIIEKDDEILLVQEGDHSKDAVGKWSQPAGWLELGEDPIEGVIKEVKEETGLDFEPTGLIGIYSLVFKRPNEEGEIVKHAVKLIFRGNFSGELMKPNEEISDLRWFTLDEIDRMEDSMLRDIDIRQEIKDYFAGTSYPLEMIHQVIQEV